MDDIYLLSNTAITYVDAGWFDNIRPLSTK